MPLVKVCSARVSRPLADRSVPFKKPSTDIILFRQADYSKT
jgi:hypothetical protein